MATGVAIQNPFTYYYIVDGDWSLLHSLEYWCKGNTVASINNNKIIKTIYDPSISNYVLPSSAAFTGFTKNGTNTSVSSDYNVSNAFLHGMSFYTIGWKTGATFHIYALGCRLGSKTNYGNIIYYDTSGTYYSAISSSTYTYNLVFEAARVNPQDSYYRTVGRCCLPTIDN